MHLRQLNIKNMKLLEDFSIDFVRRDGTIRPWTVFVGENGRCKTTILQAIALAASGPEKANQIAGDLPTRLPDLRETDTSPNIDAIFESGHPGLVRPGTWSGATALLRRHLRSTIAVPGRGTVFTGTSDDVTPGPWVGAAGTNPLSQIRGSNRSGWLCVGYGVNRNLPIPLSIETRSDPTQDRVRSLFDPRHQLVGTDFVARWEPDLARHYAELVRHALVDAELMPGIEAMDLRGRGGVSHPSALVESHRFDQKVGKVTMRVPAIALSHGYQSTIAWVADFIGQAMIDAGDEAGDVKLESLEGLVLIDELDLHLHPTWQRTLVRSLKRAFPRVQFVATTHSPLVLAGLDEDEVWILDADDRGSVTERAADESARLMTAGGILQAFFGVDRVDSQDASGVLLRHYGFLAAMPGRTNEEQREMEDTLHQLRALGIEPQLTPVERRSQADTGAGPP